ncbi:hypothetical protein ACSRUE_36295 [Sorangium sp. KYC3313]|uniref:hypothetical protein n=1 Tax=Sorangium sp. KYC3313 TaxID=3449740 RepID=UPI003F8C9D79
MGDNDEQSAATNTGESSAIQPERSLKLALPSSQRAPVPASRDSPLVSGSPPGDAKQGAGGEEAPSPAPKVSPAGATENQGNASLHELTAHKEDYLLWGLIAAVLGFVAWFFWRFTSDALTKLTPASCTASPELCDSEQRYSLAVASLKVITIRSNSAFLVGTLVCLIGCTIVLRRVRIAFQGKGGPPRFRARLATDSPGIIIAILGAAILLATLFANPFMELRESHRDAASPRDAQTDRAPESGAAQRLREYEERERKRNQEPANE